jgi:hypothetical protein
MRGSLCTEGSARLVLRWVGGGAIMEVQIEIAPADNTTKREAQEIALLIRQAIEQLDTVSCIEPIQIQRPDRTKGGAIESLQEFFVSFAPAGLRAMLGVVKAIAADRANQRRRSPSKVERLSSNSSLIQTQYHSRILWTTFHDCRGWNRV